jgi:hypothetical protein
LLFVGFSGLGCSFGFVGFSGLGYSFGFTVE